MKQRQTSAIILLAILALTLGYYAMQFVEAAPTGATVTNISTTGSPNSTPSNRTDPRGTITTVILNSVQQDQSWKAYVGNITGRLSLDNAAGMTIYDWALSGTSKNGKVYVSRAFSPDFENVSCGNAGNITQEHVYYNMSFNSSDNINHTFNYTSHSPFTVGTQSVAANQCPSTATYVNDSRQTMDGTQKFQEVFLQDGVSNAIYMTVLSTAAGYDNLQYDFQVIVPESYLSGGGTRPLYTTYYFWTELSG